MTKEKASLVSLFKKFASEFGDYTKLVDVMTQEQADQYIAAHPGNYIFGTVSDAILAYDNRVDNG